MARLEELIQAPDLKIEDSGVIYRFDRPLVWLQLPDGSTVGDKLIEEGHAKVWLPEKSKINWCTDLLPQLKIRQHSLACRSGMRGGRVEGVCWSWDADGLRLMPAGLSCSRATA